MRRAIPIRCIARVAANTVDDQNRSALEPEDAARLAGFRFEIEVMDKLERIYRLARRMAKAVLPVEVLIERAE